MNSNLIRLNKYLASQEIASRRQIDQMIEKGKIKINGQTAKLGQKIDPDKDLILVNKKTIKPTSKDYEYIILNKPKNYTSTSSDPYAYKTVFDLVKTDKRLFIVGRLDKDSEGLILLTNDGELTQKLTHPKNHIPKTYEVLILGKTKEDKINQLKNGVKLDDCTTKPCKIKILNQDKLSSFISDDFTLPSDQFSGKYHSPNIIDATLLEITLFEGKKRQIRRMAAALHLHVLSLKRTAIGSIKLGNLKTGQSKNFTSQQIKSLTN
jgi:23S rRNA pseudouridine2605 synthase